MASLCSFHQCLLLITISCIIFKLVQADTYIIHMDSLAMPRVFTDPRSWYAAILSSLSDHPSSCPKLMYTYTSATHGFSAVLSPSQLDLLQKMPGFVYAIPDVPLKPHSTHTPEFLGLDSNFGAWPESNYGKDVIIGVVDSGVWPESGSYKDHGMSDIPSRWKGKCVGDISFNSSMCNKKLIGARFFNKGIIANMPDLNITGNSTRDTEGHGTHTSSIAAGNYVNGASFFGYAPGTAKGIAPRAHLAIYKVIWDTNVYASDVIAAIDQAVEDGVDVLSISMSWGGKPLYEDPIAIASYAAVKKGIFVATSAGNAGPSAYTVDNGAPWVLTVGAGTLDRKFSGTITLGNGVSVAGESLYPGNSSLRNVPLVIIKDCYNYIELEKAAHKIAVCVGGDDDSRTDQIFFTNSVGVAGAILIGMTSQHIERFLKVTFPVTLVDYKVGQPILDYISKKSNLKASIDFGKTEVGVQPVPIVAEYSSRGPSATCPGILKPDLIAPGTMVLASWPPKAPILFQPGLNEVFSPLNLDWGTSIACPHAAGVAALLRAKYPKWSPAAIKSAMITTADSYDNTGNPISDMTGSATPLHSGAGLINPNKALNPGLVYDANADDYMRFLCSTDYTKNQIKMITRSSALNCSNPSSDINYPSFIAFFNATKSSPNPKITQVFRRTVTNVGDDISTYKAVLAHMDEIKLSVFPKTLVFKHKYEKQSFTLTIKGPASMDNYILNSSLSWVDDQGKYVVRSPIVVTRINLEDVDDID